MAANSMYFDHVMITTSKGVISPRNFFCLGHRTLVFCSILMKFAYLIWQFLGSMRNVRYAKC